MSSGNHTPRVFLVANSRKPAASEVFNRLSKLLHDRGLLIGASLDGRLEDIGQARPDYVLVLGGDGTILSVSQTLGWRQVPIVGVNLGKLGYLAAFSVAEFEEYFGRIFSDRSLITRRMMLDVSIAEPDGKKFDGVAVNDCVIRVGAPFRTIGLTLEVDEQTVTRIVADGLIIATPTGSTAHNMACGGPIIQPDVDAIILTPNAPHSLSHCPVVLGPQAQVKITLLESSEGAAIVLDGRVVGPIPGGTILRLRQSSAMFQLVHHPNRKSWDTLIMKLKWGQNLT